MKREQMALTENAFPLPRIHPESILSRWEADSRPNAKERSLYLLGYLYDITQNPIYLERLKSVSQPILSKLASLKSLSEHELMRGSQSYAVLRGISYSLAQENVSNQSLRQKLIEFYRQSLRDHVFGKESSINDRCDYAWSLAPLLASEEASQKEFQGLIEGIYREFIDTLKSDSLAFDSLANVLSCLHAFLEVEPFFNTPARFAFDVAQKHYLQGAQCDPGQERCPPQRWYFSKPYRDQNSKERMMSLAENVWMTYLLHNIDLLDQKAVKVGP